MARKKQQSSKKFMINSRPAKKNNKKSNENSTDNKSDELEEDH